MSQTTESGSTTTETVTDESSQPTSTDSWTESLPEAFRDAPFISKADSPEAALDALKNAAGHMGNSIRIPGKDASPEAQQEFYSKLIEKAPGVMPRPDPENMDAFYGAVGRPDKPDGYIFEAPEGREIPSDLEAFSSIAHKYGLSQDQYKGVLAEVLEGQYKQMEVAEHAQSEEMKALKDEWGMDFDNRMSQVRNFLKLSDAPEGIVDLFVEGAMSPKEIQWIHEVASSTKSPVELVQQHATQQEHMTPTEAQNQIQEMLNNTEHPYWNATDPRHQAAIKRMIELQKYAAPDAQMSMDHLRA